MPREVVDKEEFMKIIERAEEIRVKELEKEGIAKVKARTKKYLYTIKIPLEQLDEFLQKIKEKVGEDKIVYF